MATKNLKLDKFSQYAIGHVTGIVALLFVAGSILILFYMAHMSDIQIRSTAIEHSRLYSETLEEFRSLYTSEVVVRAKAAGLEVTHDYISKPHAIPLPATLSMLLGNRLGGSDIGVTSKLYSKYPFPWRQATGGLNSKFSRDAWAALKAAPEQPFYRFEEVDGQASLRYAVSDIMQESCIGCHNSHPDTPRVGWKTGDLRGVLEVVMPIERHTALANSLVNQTLFMLFGVLAVSLALVTYVLKQLRLSAIASEEIAIEATEINQRLEDEAVHRKKIENELRILSTTDALTGLHNRRKFDEVINQEWKRGLRNQTSIAFVMLDIDYFKRFNDSYGHNRGDDALRKVAAGLKSVVARSYDLITRLGGEEFGILMPETDLAGAIQIAEKVRTGVENLAIPHEYSRVSDVITVSVGVAVITPDKNSDHTELYAKADKALYRAKEGGRNRVNCGSTANVLSLGDKSD